MDDIDQMVDTFMFSNKITRLDALLEIQDMDELKAQVKKLHETCLQQEARIKKLEFDLEMEQGHVNILRHDNQMLRQMTVDMVRAKRI